MYIRFYKITSMKTYISTVLCSSLLLISCSESKSEKEANKEEENKLTVCDCAKMKQSEAPDECFKMKEEWQKEYENADITQKEEMTKEMIDCMNKK